MLENACIQQVFQSRTLAGRNQRLVMLSQYLVNFAENGGSIRCAHKWSVSVESTIQSCAARRRVVVAWRLVGQLFVGFLVFVLHRGILHGGTVVRRRVELRR